MLTVQRTVVGYPNILGWRVWMKVGTETFFAEASTERKAIRAARKKAEQWARYGPVSQ